jgi:hypothetical protein
MPYKSDAQRRYFNANRKELESQGVDVDEWNESSRGKKLPEKVKEKKSFDFSTITDAAKTLPAAIGTAKDTITGIPEAADRVLRQAKGQFAGTLLGGRAGAGALAGGLAGAVMGLDDDPGYDERTGKKRSRLMKALKMGLGGATLGGLANTAFPQGEQFGGQLGGQLGRHLATIKTSSVAQLASESAKKAADDESDDKPTKKKPSESKKILNMDSTGGRLADYLAPGSWGGERAGRAQAMADAIGEKTTFGVRHPLMQSAGHQLLGGGLGALLGGGLGALLGRINNPKDTEFTNNAITGGALLGGGAGLLGGAYTAGKSRRNEMKQIGHLYDQDAAAGQVDPKNPKLSLLSALLLPARGPHRTGQVEATKAMRGEQTMPEMHGGVRDVLYSSQFLPYVGAPIGLLHSYGQNIKTQLNSEGKTKNPGDLERKPKTKAASMIELLARDAVKEARCWKGYEPVPGKAPYSEDSCRPAGSGKKKKKEKKAEACSCGCGKPDGECGCNDSSLVQKLARLAVKKAEGAWTRSEGQSESGGLNAKGRASLKAQGHDIKPPVTESNPKGERAGRKASFCARMGGMKSKLTSKETANDPDSRINKSLRKWNC